MTTINNIAGISVATSANNNNQNNNIETLKGMIIAGHDGAKDFGSGEYGLTFGFKWGEYNVFVSRTYGMWLVSLYKNYKSEWTSEGRKISYDAQILDRRLGDYALGKRWSMSLAENMAKFILDTIADYEWENLMDETEKMSDIVASYQSEVDGYVEDLEKISDNYDGIKTKVDAFAVMGVLKKIKQACDDCLVAVGEISGCDMVWDDGYHVDLSEVSKWMGNYCSWGEYAYYDIDNDIVAIDCLIGADSGMPLADDETLGYIESSIVDRGELDLDWMLGYFYPTYLVDDIREYVETAYHYAYCA